jgi:hypothetical protein
MTKEGRALQGWRGCAWRVRVWRVRAWRVRDGEEEGGRGGREPEKEGMRLEVILP